MKYFLVSQNQTWKIESDENFLWSPKLTRNGYENSGYKAMSSVKRGDVIFNVHDGEIYSVSLAISDAFTSNKSEISGFNDENTIWNEDGWQVKLKMYDVSFPIKEHRNFFSQNKGKTFTKDGKLQQKYLSELTKEQVNFIRNNDPKINDVVNQLINKHVFEKEINKTQFKLTSITSRKKRGYDKSNISNKKQKLNNQKQDYNQTNIFKQEVGKKGEMLVFDYLKKKFPSAQIIGRSVNLDDKDGKDNLGYDIEVTFTDNHKYLVDVKTTTSKAGKFFVSENERQRAESTRDNPNESYFFYYIYDLNFKNNTGNITKISLDDVNLKPISYQASII